LCNEEKEKLEEDATGEGVKDAAVHPEDSKYSWVVWDGEHHIGICSPGLRRPIGVVCVVGPDA
jgi:hypothetical protein